VASPENTDIETREKLEPLNILVHLESSFQLTL